MKFELPDGPREILRALNSAGHEAYLVGGCVRDLLRGAPPQDWDICTSALPSQTRRCFPGARILETGLRHGTLTVLLAGEPYEVTTFRTDGAYTDGRRPDAVQFVPHLRQDLSRRDFTVNAMAMDAQGALQDPFHGAADLAAGFIRCVGEPDRRFQEDGLRVMRALRFASALGFSIEPRTARSIHSCRHMLSRVAAERINAELCKLLTGPAPGAVLRAFPDVLWEFWPELGGMARLEQHSPWHCFDVWAHTIAAVEHAPRALVLRLTLLLHDVGKPLSFTLDEDGIGHCYGHAALSAAMADDMLGRLKFDRRTRTRVVELVARHDAQITPERKSICRWLNRLGAEHFAQLLEVQRADSLGQRPELVRDRLERLGAVREMTGRVLAEQQCFTLRDLAVDGRDVLRAGVRPGPGVGALLRRLMDQVIDGALPNDREALLAAIRRQAPPPDGPPRTPPGPA